MTPARHVANLSIERAAVARAQLRGNEEADRLVARTERETVRLMITRPETETP